MLNIIEDYKKLLFSVDAFIKESGYRINYITEKMNMPTVTFYHKRKNAGFTILEMEKLFEILNSAEMEDSMFFKIMDSNKEKVFASPEEIDTLYN